MPSSLLLADARRFGELLGLTEGTGGPTTVRMVATDWDAFTDLSMKAGGRSWEKYDGFLAGVQALYLPSLVRTFFNNDEDTFTAVLPGLYEVFLDIMRMHPVSPLFYRFVRENPAEARQYRNKMLVKIVDWAGNIIPVSRSTVPVKSMYDIVRLCSTLVQAERCSMDNSAGIIRIEPNLRAQLRNCWPTLKSIQPLVDPLDQELYKVSFGLLTTLVYPKDWVQMKGKEFIDCCVKADQHVPWWICQARIGGNLSLEGSARQCDKIKPGDDLKTCARCQAIRYCSPRHQKLHWEKHKLSCVKPSW